MDEFAATIGVGEWTAKKLVREGAVLSVKIGDRRLVPVSAVRDYVNRLVAEAEGERKHKSTKKPRYTTIEQLEAAFQAALAKLPPEERDALLRRLDSIEVTDEELDRFNREHPGFSEQVMRLARHKDGYGDQK